MAFYQFEQTQKINTSKDDLWKFISSPSNLKKIIWALILLLKIVLKKCTKEC